MLSIQQVQAHLARVSYKPGWSFEAYQGAWEGHHIVINTQVPDFRVDGKIVDDPHAEFADRDL
jgi:hypothetical protein